MRFTAQIALVAIGLLIVIVYHFSANSSVINANAAIVGIIQLVFAIVNFVDVSYLNTSPRTRMWVLGLTFAGTSLLGQATTILLFFYANSGSVNGIIETLLFLAIQVANLELVTRKIMNINVYNPKIAPTL